MTRDSFLRALRREGFRSDEATYYADHYPTHEWPELLAWARSPPDLDACDDTEADLYYA